MTEVGPADRSGLLQSKRAECSSIARSRKRKLRELYSVATDHDAAPTDHPKDFDAPPATPAESHFLLESDFFQGRTFNDTRIPKRHTRHAAAIQKFLETRSALSEQAPEFPTKNGSKKSTSRPVTVSAPSQSRKDGSKSLPEAGSAPRTGQNAGPASPAPSFGAVKPAPIEFNVVKTMGGDAPTTQQHLPGHSSPSGTESRTSRSPSEAAPLTTKRSPSKERMQNGTLSPSGLSRPIQGSAHGIQITNHDLSSMLTAAAPPPSLSKSRTTAVDAGSEVLDIKDPGPLSIQVPPADPMKTLDILSSPGSTAQTATTPAIHEASTDTSPDHEGAQYVDPEEGKPETGQSNDQLKDRAPASRGSGDQTIPVPRDGHVIVNGVEAQILGEPAAATTAKQNDPQTAATNGSQGTREGRLGHATGEMSKKPSGPLTEIRDSQESSPVDAMDIDAPHDQRDVRGFGPGGQPTASDPSSHVGAQASAAQEATRRPLSLVTPNVIAGSSRPTSSLGQQDSQQSHDASFAAKLKTKQRTGAPTVVFGKQQKRARVEKTMSTPRSKSSNLLSEDYFTPLFIQNFAQQSSKRIKHLDHLVQSAQKTVSTPDLQTAILENQACKILKRVYHLQQADKWSLRQPKRCPEPIRNPSHWDTLIQEMKWMRTDFREERKWKRTVARNLALDCAEWVAADPEQRRALQVNASIPPKAAASDGHDASPGDDSEQGTEEAQIVATPDLISSGDSPPDIDDLDVLPLTVAPSTIFAMRDNDVVFELQQTAASERLLKELPLYGLPLRIPQANPTHPEFDPDAQWKRPALPLSKYVEGQQVLVKSSHPSRKSRYRYDEEEDSDDDQSPFGPFSSEKVTLKRENTDVALFDPDMAPIRDRAQAGQHFRPPTEYNMPPQSFYEQRLASQWTMHEDDQLKALVREYSYNWSLISSIVSNKSVFSSVYERRTPWECFERWTCLEGIPEMGKTQYFKIFQSRIDSSQKLIAEQNQKALQQAGASGALTPVPKRQPSTTRRVDRRKSIKYLAMFDAMRRLAKKRETIHQKQQAAAAASAARKAPDAATPKTQLKTPRDYSIMRWERDQQLAEKMAQYAQRQQEANRRNQMIARGQGQPGGQPGGGAQLPPQVAAQLAANPLASASRANVPSQLAIPGQPRPRVPMPAAANGVPGIPPNMRGGMVPPVPINGITQAEMQARAVQNMQMPNGQPDMRLVMQARMVQEQQRLAVLQQQQQGPQQQQPQSQQQQQQQGQPGQQGQQGQQPSPGIPGGQGSPHGIRNGVNGINQQNYMANAQAMMSPYSAPNGAGMATPATNGMSTPTLSAGSPRSLATPQAQQMVTSQHLAALASQMTPIQQQQIGELERSFRAKNPNLSAADARNLAISNLAIISRNQAMNAAAGGSPHHPLMNGITGTSPHQYAQLLRAQQQQQAQQQQAQVGGGSPQPPQHQRQLSAGSASGV